MNFAIVGCGVIALTHARALERLERETLYAVCDIIPEKADAFARQHHVQKVYYTADDVMADPQVDIVCVCVPSGTHGEICIKAARAGKAIVCEKPMEITPARMEQIVREVEQAGVKMQCIFQRRLMPAAIAVKRAVQQGLLGKICLAQAELKYYRDQAYYNSAGWRGTWEQDGGGALMNQGVHGVDLILWMLNDQVDTLYGQALTLARKIPVEDTASATLRMKSGALCTIAAATTAYPGFSTTFAIHGERGSVVFDDQGIITWEFLDQDHAPPRPDAGEAVGGARSNVDISIDGHTALLDDIACALREKRPVLIPPQDAMDAVRVICAIYESTRTGQVLHMQHV